MRRIAAALIVAVLAATVAVAGIEVSVSRGAAAENLFAGKNFDFENGLAGWMNKHTNDAPIRQVKAVGDSYRILFDSGIVDGGATWTRRIPIGSCRRVKVYAVDANGKVAVAESVKEEVEKKSGK